MALRLRVKELAESKGFNISTLRIAKALEVPATELIEDVPDKED